MMRDAVGRIDELAREMDALFPVMDRSTHGASWPDAPGRMARLATAIDDRQREAWARDLDTARRFREEFHDLARGVRAAGRDYGRVDADQGVVRWTR